MIHRYELGRVFEFGLNGALKTGFLVGGGCRRLGTSQEDLILYIFVIAAPFQNAKAGSYLLRATIG